MELQVLIATMDQDDHALLKKMNVRSSAIVANQCDRNEVEHFKWQGYPVSYLSFNERGVGLNRNNALMRATADICLMADDDVIFHDRYMEALTKAFEQYPDTDVILVNLEEPNPSRYVITRPTRVRWYNFMRYGTPRISFRRESVTKNGIAFNLHFGGGSDYNAGEDTLFLYHCLKSGLKMMALPVTIGVMDDSRPSSWFRGYNEKFFLDKGALYAAISNYFAWLLCLQYALRHRASYRNERTFLSAVRLMFEGARSFRSRR